MRQGPTNSIAMIQTHSSIKYVRSMARPSTRSFGIGYQGPEKERSYWLYLRGPLYGPTARKRYQQKRPRCELLKKIGDKQKLYEHRYKHGKQKTIMPNAVFEAAMHDAVNQGELLEHLAYVTLLWHTGVRKSEAYERLLSDVTVTKKFVIVDFHKRKKGGEEVPPLNIPVKFFGVKDFLMPWIYKRLDANPPHKSSWKSLKKQVETEETRVTLKGKTVTIKKTITEKKRCVWLFPHVASTSAWRIVKRILGPQYYPHYLRLRKLSRVGSNPKTKSIVHLKSLSGLKSISAISAYMGFDKDLQDEAMSENE